MPEPPVDEVMKPRRGRPPKDRSAEASSTPTPAVPKAAPAPVVEPKRAMMPAHQRLFEALNIGDVVQWYPKGDRNAKPLGAIIVKKTSGEMGGRQWGAFEIQGFGPGVPKILVNESGVRHIDDPHYAKFQRETIGAWDATPLQKALIDLLDEGDDDGGLD